MAISNLLSVGHPNRSALEKFADICNAPARNFWSDRRSMTFLKQDGLYTLRVSNKTMNGSSRLSKGFESCVNSPYLGSFAALILLIAYGLLSIPVALTMGVGLVAKKIALATDPDSRRYQSIAQKYLTFNHLKKLEGVKAYLKDSAEKLEALKETLPTLAVTQNDLDSLKRHQEESIKRGSPLIERLTRETASRTERLNILRTEIEKLAKAYLHLNPEEGFTLNLS